MPNEHRAALALVALVLCLRLLFFFPGFGESDAARLANDALLWQQTGSYVMEPSDYRVRVSPLYVHALRGWLEVGPPETLPQVMNAVNVVAAPLLVGLAYLLWGRWVGSRPALLAACLLPLQPGLWEAGLWGMPHLGSMVFLLAALLACDRYLEDRRPLWLVLTGLGAFLCLALKADTILCFAAFPALWLRARGQGLRPLVSLLLVLAVALPLLLGYARVLSPQAPPTGQFAEQWNRQYPYTLANFVDPDEARLLALTPGPVVALVVVVGAVVVARSGQWWLLIVALSWGLPQIVFWGGIHGNSLRHMAAGWLGMTVLAGPALVLAGRAAPWLAAVVVVANYFSMGPSGPYGWLTTRVFESASRRAQVLANLRRAAEPAASLEGQVAVLGTWTNPYALNRLLVHRPVREAAFEEPGLLRLKLQQGGEVLFLEAGRVPRERLEELQSQGWRYWSMEPGTRERMMN